MKNLTYPQAKYLKHAGSELDVKVTLKPTKEGEVEIYMRDFVFCTFQSALHFLRHVASTEIAPSLEVVK